MRLNCLPLVLIYGLMIGTLYASVAECRHGRHWYHAGMSYEAWRGGYWFHGAYLDRHGWWWVVGPRWYYYPEPIYPYPAFETAPAYFVTVSNAPPASETSADQGAKPSVKTARPVAPVAPNANKPTAFSYYCTKTRSYYPIAPSCEDGWIATPVQAPN